MLAGEKVAVAPAGRPLTVRVNASGKVEPVPGVRERLKAAAPPGGVVAVALDGVPAATVKPLVTGKEVVAEAAV
jgi:hypothetical protein